MILFYNQGIYDRYLSFNAGSSLTRLNHMYRRILINPLVVVRYKRKKMPSESQAG